MLSMFNDNHVADFDAMCISEPYIFAHPTTGEPIVNQHNRWGAITPGQHNPDASSVRHSFRAAIWISERVTYQQEETGSPDVVAITAKVEGASLLLFSIYVPNLRRDGAELEQRVAVIQDVIRRAREKIQGTLHVYVGGDFNRHSNVWGDRVVAQQRRGEDWPILQLMIEEELDSLLPRGTITYSNNDGSRQTTIDLVLVSPGLQAAATQCKIGDTEHGGDHRVIESRFQLQWTAKAVRRPKRAYDRADWTKIRKGVALLPQIQPIQTQQQLDDLAEQFVQGVADILEDNIPYTKPHPKGKRWWTPALSAIRNTLSSLRNEETTRRRRDQECTAVHSQMLVVRRNYFSQMAVQKAKHWAEFVGDPANVWKANKFTQLEPGSRGVPALKGPGGLVEQDEEKADIMLQAFFPPQPDPEPRDDGGGQDTHPTVPYKRITLDEVRNAIFQSSPNKAPGPDDIPTLVWRNVWEEAKDNIMALYRASLKLGHLPKTWRNARIVPLRKPGKPDYTIPKAFRPISLLATISKGLEAVVANRLSYMAEHHSLLPGNHFGARKRRSCEQALNILVERIYAAWRKGLVLTLLTFDVQGAFNGVNKTVLQARLLERGIPKTLGIWIQDFCSDRTATITLDTFESEVLPIAQAGIPQGSPLSPILYIFYNANLVEQPINDKGGAIGFVDDYTPWVVGPDADANIRTLQDTIIPKAERWARESGATFEPSKTGLIHFTYRTKQAEQHGPHLQFQGHDVPPSEEVKILGVTFDKHMTFSQHVARVTAKATKQCLAIRRLRGVRPKQVRQLYNATVVPIMDYGASVWYGPGKYALTIHLADMDKVQRIGASAITLAFKSAALLVTQAEASLLDTESRLQRRVANHFVRCLTVPATNPLFDQLSRIWSQSKTHISPMALVAKKLGPAIGVTAESIMETVEPAIQEPWLQGIPGCTFQGLDSTEDDVLQQMGRRTRAEVKRTLWTDAAVRRGRAGIAVVQGNPLKTIVQREVPWLAAPDSTTAELLAIEAALSLQTMKRPKPKATTVATDSKWALARIAQGDHPGGQYVVRYIRRHISVLYNEGEGQVKLQWVPAHRGLQGNEEADRGSKGAIGEADPLHHLDSPNPPNPPNHLNPLNRIGDTNEGGSPAATFPKLTLSQRYIRRNSAPSRIMELRVTRKGLQTKLDAHFRTTQFARPDNPRNVGQYTWKLDGALPGPHAAKLFNALTSQEAFILSQCRTGQSRLNSCLFRKRLSETAGCACGAARETVAHVLYECPLLQHERQAVIEVVGKKWRDQSYILGGWNPWVDPQTGRPVDGPREKWKANIPVVKAVLSFLHKTGRFHDPAGVKS
jgi:ribonuclease HI